MKNVMTGLVPAIPKHGRQTLCAAKPAPSPEGSALLDRRDKPADDGRKEGAPPGLGIRLRRLRVSPGPL
jgi:hypothetical protein